MSKAYYKIIKEEPDVFFWELHSANGSEVAFAAKDYRTESECLEAINRLEVIVASKPRCILPDE